MLPYHSPLFSFAFFIHSQKHSKTNQKSSTELYREAAQMLGMSCEFTENCRCLDCQVNAKLIAKASAKFKGQFSHFFHPPTLRADTLTVMMTTIPTHFRISQLSSKPRNFPLTQITLKHFIIVMVTTDIVIMEMEHVKMPNTSNNEWYE